MDDNAESAPRPWQRRKRPSRRGLAIALAFILTPAIVAVVVAVSSIPNRPDAQKLVLSLAAALWLLSLSVIRLPADAVRDYARLRKWIARYRLWVAVPVAAAAFLGVLAILTPEKLRLGVLSVTFSLLLWPFAGVLYLAWRRVSWIAASIIAVIVILVPLGVLKLIGALGLTLSAWQALLVIVLPSFVGLAYVYGANRIERTTHERYSKLRGKTGAEAEWHPQERPRGGLALLSVGCAVLSSLLLLATAIRVPLERRLIETSQVAERGAVVGGVTLRNPDTLTLTEERRLHMRYFPVLRLHKEEEFIAYDASRAFNAAVGRSEDKACAEPTDEPCRELALERSLRDLPPDSRLPEARVFGEGAAYPRLVRVRSEVEELGEAVPSFARSTEWLLQYWLFYPHNKWEAPSAVGSLVQEHGGDWEWVGVGLDRAAAPVFVSYSAHCAGSWRPWSQAASVAVVRSKRPKRVRVIVGGGSDLVRPTHPLVIVARGSHANYATPGIREPDWGSCQFKNPFAARAIRWLTFIMAAREETPDLGSFQVPDVLTTFDTDRDAGRALWWGEGGQTKFGAIEIAADDHGPSSPSFQKEAWDHPIATIFGSTWECDAGEAACEGSLEEDAADPTRRP